ncbi:abortive infection Abi-like protein [Roseimicrobium gellanilyticum]|uniref:Abortive infection Abi-like protein n=1 Tax=Roseimicrobium gellanilyticum TaxID=748857 RepID=A0A366HQM5_9BACT|nr:abortive infection family protein [Roseimicrobium gellanilyticum]RBP45950.1 abortive infection Abi-like protein [Roseimicrobium gellanilyticum]
MANSAPLSDSIVFALAKVVDDAQSETRYPSHNEIEFMVNQCGLSQGDPKAQGQVVGKAKRVRAILSWALENDLAKGERFVALLVSNVRSNGGFREASSNFVGVEAIVSLRACFAEQGFNLATDGVLQPSALDSLEGVPLTKALRAYVERARKGVEDAALLTGTSKDLLEATAAHIVTERYGTYPQTSNFPTLLGQAFVVAGLATPQDAPTPGEGPERRVQRALYEVGCAVNKLRNKQGTGHGRPWLPTVTGHEAKCAVEVMGTIAGYLLSTLPPSHG